jgi:hypothetical protein
MIEVRNARTAALIGLVLDPTYSRRAGFTTMLPPGSVISRLTWMGDTHSGTILRSVTFEVRNMELGGRRWLVLVTDPDNPREAAQLDRLRTWSCYRDEPRAAMGERFVPDEEYLDPAPLI